MKTNRTGELLSNDAPKVEIAMLAPYGSDCYRIRAGASGFSISGGPVAWTFNARKKVKLVSRQAMELATPGPCVYSLGSTLTTELNPREYETLTEEKVVTGKLEKAVSESTCARKLPVHRLQENGYGSASLLEAIEWKLVTE